MGRSLEESDLMLIVARMAGCRRHGRKNRYPTEKGGGGTVEHSGGNNQLSRGKQARQMICTGAVSWKEGIEEI